MTNLVFFALFFFCFFVFFFWGGGWRGEEGGVVNCCFNGVVISSVFLSKIFLLPPGIKGLMAVIFKNT